MAADPIRELHRLIDQLSEEDANALLADARRFVVQYRKPHELPTSRVAPPIADLDELNSNLFPLDENADEFDAMVRQWRDEGSAQRG
jgi:hypothetical protein